MKKREQNKLKVVYHQVEGLSEEEIQRRLARAFDVLFTETLKKQDKIQ